MGWVRQLSALGAGDLPLAGGKAANLGELLRASPGGRRKARLAQFLIGRIRGLVGLRETPKFAAVKVMTAQREGLLESAAELVRAGILEKADDVFFLRLADLRAIAEGMPGDWRERVASARRVYERELRRRLVPRLMLSDGTAFYEGVKGDGEGPGPDGAVVMAGSAVSPGVVEGAARVVLDPHGARLVPGEILVCVGTDPGWTPLFLAAGWLVMEVGGMMTHGSVVAREYGIPAVLGVTRATTRILTGSRIRVDGNTGWVTILSGQA